MRLKLLFLSLLLSLLLLGTSDAQTPSPTSSPTKNPTGSPTSSPTKNPTGSPTTSPTKNPTESPTTSPTKNPTKSPTKNPTESPTSSPTQNPTTTAPTENPTSSPTRNPTQSPTTSPTKNPTQSPTKNPTKNPTQSPTRNPTESPTTSPTKNPTTSPTKNPTKSPTESPTKNPTTSPTKNPTKSPTTPRPTPSPTGSPTKNPTESPTKNPTESPTESPTQNPTTSPTENPTKNPTVSPTKNPTTSPTKNPTRSPTESPTKNPTTSPTESPTRNPTTPSPTESPTIPSDEAAAIGGLVGGAVGGICVLGIIIVAFMVSRNPSIIFKNRKSDESPNIMNSFDEKKTGFIPDEANLSFGSEGNTSGKGLPVNRAAAEINVSKQKVKKDAYQRAMESERPLVGPGQVANAQILQGNASKDIAARTNEARKQMRLKEEKQQGRTYDPSKEDLESGATRITSVELNVLGGTKAAPPVAAPPIDLERRASHDSVDDVAFLDALVQKHTKPPAKAVPPEVDPDIAMLDALVQANTHTRSTAPKSTDKNGVKAKSSDGARPDSQYLKNGAHDSMFAPSPEFIAQHTTGVAPARPDSGYIASLDPNRQSIFRPSSWFLGKHKKKKGRATQMSATSTQASDSKDIEGDI